VAALLQPSSRPALRSKGHSWLACSPGGAIHSLVAVRDRLQARLRLLEPASVTGKGACRRSVYLPQATRSLSLSYRPAASKRPADRLFPRCPAHLCRHALLPSPPRPAEQLLRRCSVNVDATSPTCRLFLSLPICCVLRDGAVCDGAAARAPLALEGHRLMHPAVDRASPAPACLLVPRTGPAGLGHSRIRRRRPTVLSGGARPPPGL